MLSCAARPSSKQHVPVAVRLSKLFYERLGDQVVNELVELLNQVDATYRGELRELNEINFSKFDAKLAQRLAELRAELSQRIEERIGELKVRIASLDAKIDGVATRLGAEIDSRVGTSEAKLEAMMERGFREQTGRLFAAWLSLLIPIVGFGLAALRR